MKIQVLSNDSKLLAQLEGRDNLKAEKINEFKEFNADILIISDSFIEPGQLALLFNNLDKRVFYLVSNKYDSSYLEQIRTICNSLDIYMLPPKLTIEQVVNDIYETLFPSQNKGKTNVVTFFSSISNVGVTSTAISTALAISELTNARVGVIGANAWDDGIEHIGKYKGKYLSEIKTQLTNSLLDEDAMEELFHKIGLSSVYYLAGNQNTKMERLYTIEEIDYLISMAKKVFDLVIVDAGSHFDNANMMQGLKHADLKLLVINQQRKAIKKFEQNLTHILTPLGYKKNDFLLIINRYNDDSGLFVDREIQAEFNIPYLTSIPDLINYGLLSELNGKALYEFEDKEYNSSIQHIARGIVKRSNLLIKDLETTTKSKWNLFRK
jgi:MinD-like ATPase involved in chromosome partitioning or flagellar assembly